MTISLWGWSQTQSLIGWIFLGIATVVMYLFVGAFIKLLMEDDFQPYKAISGLEKPARDAATFLVFVFWPPLALWGMTQFIIFGVGFCAKGSLHLFRGFRDLFSLLVQKVPQRAPKSTQEDEEGEVETRLPRAIVIERPKR